MEIRIILFLLISFGIIFSSDFVMKELGLLPEPPPIEEGQEQVTGDGPDAVPPTGTFRGSGQDQQAHEPEFSDVREGPLNVEGSIETIETPLYRVEFNTRGAQIQSWKLKRYLTQDEEDPQPIEFVYPEGRFAGPMSLRVAAQSVNDALTHGVFEVSRDFDTLSDLNPTGHVTLTYRDEDVLVEKDFTFHHDSYLVDASFRVDGLDDVIEVVLGTNFGVVEWGQGFSVPWGRRG